MTTPTCGALAAPVHRGAGRLARWVCSARPGAAGCPRRSVGARAPSCCELLHPPAAPARRAPGDGARALCGADGQACCASGATPCIGAPSPAERDLPAASLRGARPALLCGGCRPAGEPPVPGWLLRDAPPDVRRGRPGLLRQRVALRGWGGLCTSGRCAACGGSAEPCCTGQPDLPRCPRLPDRALRHGAACGSAPGSPAARGRRPAAAARLVWGAPAPRSSCGRGGELCCVGLCLCHGLACEAGRCAAPVAAARRETCCMSGAACGSGLECSGGRCARPSPAGPPASPAATGLAATWAPLFERALRRLRRRPVPAARATCVRAASSVRRAAVQCRPAATPCGGASQGAGAVPRMRVTRRATGRPAWAAAGSVRHVARATCVVRAAPAATSAAACGALPARTAVTAACSTPATAPGRPRPTARALADCAPQRRRARVASPSTRRASSNVRSSPMGAPERRRSTTDGVHRLRRRERPPLRERALGPGAGLAAWGQLRRTEHPARVRVHGAFR